MTPHTIQLDQHGRLKHFLTTEGLSRQILTSILDYAESFAGVSGRAVKKVPLLRGKTVANLFFESSTRTRTTFELAAKRLSADVLNINIATSATNKGETLQDTLHTLEAMHCDMFVVRHGNSGAAHFIAGQVAENVHVINAGDGRHAHPTQAMLDMFTIRPAQTGFRDPAGSHRRGHRPLPGGPVRKYTRSTFSGSATFASSRPKPLSRKTLKAWEYRYSTT